MTEHDGANRLTNGNPSGDDRSKRRRRWAALAAAGVAAAILWSRWPTSDAAVEREQPSANHAAGGAVRVPAGVFAMGGADSPFADQRPVHRVELRSFWLDRTPVTNRQFARFVEQTGHVTTAERRGWSSVFDPDAKQWQRVEFAHWRRPLGPQSSIAGRDEYPVVQVSWYDASAYASWSGKRLPTEAEYEYAARGGLADCDFPWGRKLKPDGQCKANFWQGWFPHADAAEDGYAGVSPVNAFPPNRYGLYDMAGNVWCWCSDWYAADFYALSGKTSPSGPTSGEQRVRRGGSWLSSTNYGDGLRVSYRDHAPPGEATNHSGFRCARSAR